jgi:hypothetical protein
MHGFQHEEHQRVSHVYAMPDFHVLILHHKVQTHHLQVNVLLYICVFIYNHSLLMIGDMVDNAFYITIRNINFDFKYFCL